MRRPPLGHVQATAHDMGREYTAMSALADTGVPVPRTYAHCADDSVLGAPFYVMERVDGVAYRKAAELDALGTERTAAIAGRLVEVLAALHAVDPQAGRARASSAGRRASWSGRCAAGASSSRAPRPASTPTPTSCTACSPSRWLPSRPRTRRWSGSCTATTGSTTAWSATDDQIHAVVDWEMATLGDTRTDVALMLVYETLGASAGGDLVSDVAKAQGWPGNQQQLAAYTAASGRELGDMNWHLALAYFKLAVILEGIHYRYLKGQTVGEGFDRIGEGFDLIVAAGLHSLKEN